jgi:hypothetical protein
VAAITTRAAERTVACAPALELVRRAARDASPALHGQVDAMLPRSRFEVPPRGSVMCCAASAPLTRSRRPDCRQRAERLILCWSSASFTSDHDLPTEDAHQFARHFAGLPVALACARRPAPGSHELWRRGLRDVLRKAFIKGAGYTDDALSRPIVAIDAGRLGIRVDLQRLDRIARETPVLVDLKPSGQHYMEDLHRAGGLVTVMRRLRHLLNLDALTVTGRTLGDEIDAAPADFAQQVVRPFDAPVYPQGGIAVLYGNLAPGGAIIKQSAANAQLMEHTGRAVVFEDAEDLARRIDDPALDVNADDILVLRQIGPVGRRGCRNPAISRFRRSSRGKA